MFSLKTLGRTRPPPGFPHSTPVLSRHSVRLLRCTSTHFLSNVPASVLSPIHSSWPRTPTKPFCLDRLSLWGTGGRGGGGNKTVAGRATVRCRAQGLGTPGRFRVPSHHRTQAWQDRETRPVSGTSLGQAVRSQPDTIPVPLFPG